MAAVEMGRRHKLLAHGRARAPGPARLDVKRARAINA